MKKVCLILAIILENTYAVECYDGSKWRDVPDTFLPKLGSSVYQITNHRSDCEEAFEAYIEYEKFKERKSNYTEDNDESNSDGIGDGLAGLLGGGGGGIATKAKGSIRTPSERDLDVVGTRSAADIMKVVRQRTPGLRHIYNKFLKKKPGFQGKVTLKFTIAPSGEIISISNASSTTNYGEFDNEIKTAVSRWKFSKVKSGNTITTIPFTFAE